jgi:hypothetical protein
MISCVGLGLAGFTGRIGAASDRAGTGGVRWTIGIGGANQVATEIGDQKPPLVKPIVGALNPGPRPR